MSVTKNYNRPKATTINNTGIVMGLFVTEKPITNPTSNGVLTAGNTGEANISILADADETGGTTIRPIFRIKITPSLDSIGILTYTLSLYSVEGDVGGTEHLISSLTFEHPEDMDTWQAAAGRPRQS